MTSPRTILRHTCIRRLACLPACLLSLASVPPAQADLLTYVHKPEPAFHWKLKEKKSLPQGTIYDLHLVSQVWQGVTWTHQLQVYQPKNVAPSSTILLWNQGGKAGLAETALGMQLAAKTQAPCAFLFGIPNQPLLDGKREDALIAETFVRYLRTQDEDWPLLFPMTKSLVRAMDALQAFSQQEWDHKVERFVVSGGSKRGWTTWLTAAADPRVKAIVPIVIDTLNMRAQMPHQLKSFGAYSEQVADYTGRGLIPMPDTADAKRLWNMVDPYAYRDRLTLPKLLINGNNDPYWSVDALNLYWDDLKGEKWVTYVPNAGHDLQQRHADGRRDFSRAVGALAAFARHQLIDNPMPKLSWKHDDVGGKLRLVVHADQPPAGARLWVAHSLTADFRKSKWVDQPATVSGSDVRGEVSPPADGRLAFYGELDYGIDGVRYQLSTQIRVAQPASASAGGQ